MLDRVFKLSAHGTTAGRELRAGLATFAATACIRAVNPRVLMVGYGADPVGTGPASLGHVAVHGAFVTARPRGLPVSGYVIAAVFFLKFFPIVPFHS